jgi:P pilus assembly chaperone PapD
MNTPRFLLALALAAAPLLASATVTIGVDKAELITDLAAGEKRILKLTVTNSGSEATPVTVYPEDWQIINGAPDFNNQTHPRALGRRVTVAPTNFDLAPGAAQEVTVVVDAGTDPFTAGSYWSAVFVQTARLAPPPPTAAGRGAQMRIVERIGVLLFADSAPEPKPLPADIAITGIKRTPTGLGVAVRNPSPYMRLASSATVSLTPLSGGQTQTIPLRAFRLLPGATQEIAIDLPAAVAGLGRTSVLAVIDYGAQDLVVGEARLTF